MSPWASKAMQRWGNSPSGIAAMGAAKVHEFNEATKAKPGGFATLPKRKGGGKHMGSAMRIAAARRSRKKSASSAEQSYAARRGGY